MTKAELISYLQSFYEYVDTTEIEEAGDSFGDVKLYKRKVLTVGESIANQQPISYHLEIFYYVYREGEVDEAAYFSMDEPNKFINDNVTGSTLVSISSIYNNSELFNRTLAACIVAAGDILNEDPGTANHDKRLLWAGKMVSKSNWNEGVNVMLAFIAMNATVQSNGGGATDNDIKYIVNSNIDGATEILGL
jgi:hypothetical protein